MTQFHSCGPSCGHSQSPQFIAVPVPSQPQAPQQPNLMDAITMAQQQHQAWENLVKTLQKEKKEEKKEGDKERGLLKGLTKNEIFLVMLLIAPIIGKVMDKLYKVIFALN